MEETLEELEKKYFMLQMADTWDSSDYKYAEDLREKIKKKKENTNETKNSNSTCSSSKEE